MRKASEHTAFELTALERVRVNPEDIEHPSRRVSVKALCSGQRSTRSGEGLEDTL